MNMTLPELAGSVFWGSLGKLFYDGLTSHTNHLALNYREKISVVMVSVFYREFVGMACGKLTE